MILSDWKDQLYNLILTGHLSSKEEISEEDIDVTLSLLYRGAEEDPALLLDSLTIAIQKNVMGMVILSMSIVFSKTDPAYLSSEATLNAIYFILSYCDAKDLLNLVKNLKYKTFGKGLGSKPQKIIRRVMEAWPTETLKAFIITHPSSVYALLRLVHPRYRGERGRLVQDLLVPQKS